MSCRPWLILVAALLAPIGAAPAQIVSHDPDVVHWATAVRNDLDTASNQPLKKLVNVKKMFPESSRGIAKFDIEACDGEKTVTNQGGRCNMVAEWLEKGSYHALAERFARKGCSIEDSADACRTWAGYFAADGHPDVAKAVLSVADACQLSYWCVYDLAGYYGWDHTDASLRRVTEPNRSYLQEAFGYGCDGLHEVEFCIDLEAVGGPMRSTAELDRIRAMHDQEQAERDAQDAEERASVEELRRSERESSFGASLNRALDQMRANQTPDCPSGDKIQCESDRQQARLRELQEQRAASAGGSASASSGSQTQSWSDGLYHWFHPLHSACPAFDFSPAPGDRGRAQSACQAHGVCAESRGTAEPAC